MCGTACAPSTSTSAPAACASAIISLDRVDRAQRVRDLRERDELRARAAAGPRTRRGAAAPSSVIGMNSRSPSFSWTSSCHGTRFAWCSISVSTIASPRSMFRRPHAYATRLIASVALRVQTISCGSGALMNRATLRARRLVRRGRALADLVDPAMDVRVVLAVVGVHRLDHGERLLRRRGRVEVDRAAGRGPASRIGKSARSARGRAGRADRRRVRGMTGGAEVTVMPQSPVLAPAGTRSASSGTSAARPAARRIGP